MISLNQTIFNHNIKGHWPDHKLAPALCPLLKCRNAAEAPLHGNYYAFIVLIRKSRPIFIGNLGLFRVHLYGLTTDA